MSWERATRRGSKSSEGEEISQRTVFGLAKIVSELTEGLGVWCGRCRSGGIHSISPVVFFFVSCVVDAEGVCTLC